METVSLTNVYGNPRDGHGPVVGVGANGTKTDVILVLVEDMMGGGGGGASDEGNSQGNS